MSLVFHSVIRSWRPTKLFSKTFFEALNFFQDFIFYLNLRSVFYFLYRVLSDPQLVFKWYFSVVFLDFKGITLWLGVEAQCGGWGHMKLTKKSPSLSVSDFRRLHGPRVVGRHGRRKETERDNVIRGDWAWWGALVEKVRKRKEDLLLSWHKNILPLWFERKETQFFPDKQKH